MKRAHLPALDGLRGVAVLLVLAFHYRLRPWPWTGRVGSASYGVLRFGWSGVDLFFVLSGFLITGILWAARSEPNYYRNFYARRTLRIFPLYYATLAMLFVVLPIVIGWRDAFPTLPVGLQMWFWTYTSNLRVAIWPRLPTGFNTGHFWSLAVEEQFYLLWPAALIALSRRRATWLAAGAIAVALALRCWLVWCGNVQAAYVLMPARMDALAAGALLALAADRGGLTVFGRRPWTMVAIGALGLGLLFVWRGTVSDIDPGIAAIGYTVVAGWWAAVLAAVLGGTILTRLLSGAVVRWFGRRSYGIYVLHYPILVMFRRGGSPLHSIELASHTGLASYVLWIAANLVLTLAATEISWRVLESPLLRLKDRFREPAVPSIEAAATASATMT